MAGRAKYLSGYAQVVGKGDMGIKGGLGLAQSFYGHQ